MLAPASQARSQIQPRALPSMVDWTIHNYVTQGGAPAVYERPSRRNTPACVSYGGSQGRVVGRTVSRERVSRDGRALAHYRATMKMNSTTVLYSARRTCSNVLMLIEECSEKSPAAAVVRAPDQSQLDSVLSQPDSVHVIIHQDCDSNVLL